MSDSFFRFFATLPLQGPGSDDDTLRVLNAITPLLPTRPSIADLGCGTGRSTLVLARSLPEANITALDKIPLFIDVLREKILQVGLNGRVQPLVGDMLTPPFEPDTLDLIWSEGAAYSIGLEVALRTWRPLLRSKAYCVLSECEWLSTDRPTEVVAFWDKAYPGMGDRSKNMQRAQAAGYKVLDIFVLSDRGWDEYYMAITSSMNKVASDALPEWFVNCMTREIEVRRQAQGCFGYVFYILQPQRT